MPAPRIIGGIWRGRALAAPEGLATRPTASRVRQALFDILLHAPWAEDAVIGRTVLDVFAGSGALGLEALSRGAVRARFLETDHHACNAIRHNIAACQATDRADLIATSALSPPNAPEPHHLVILDPPYGQDLIPKAIAALSRAGWIAPHAIIAAERGRTDPIPTSTPLLAERTHGAASLAIWRLAEV